MANVRVASVCLAVIVLGAGCLAGPSSSGPAPEVPDRPANLTKESVAQYTVDYEVAAVYRAVQSRGADVQVNCGAVIDAVTDDGYYVDTTCDGTITHRDGTRDDVRPVEHTYFVNHTATRRVGERGMGTRAGS